MAEPDMINHPPHYTQGDIECIDAIAAALGPEGFQAYCRGTIIKYSWRIEHKGAGSQDLGKIGWYADRAIAARKTTGPQPTGIQVEMGPYEVAMFALGSLHAVERMVTVEGKPLTNGGQVKILEAFAVAKRLVHNPKVMAPLPVMPEGNRTGIEPPLGGMTGTEFESLLEAVGALRKAMNAIPSATNAGVVHAAAQHFAQRAMGDALTRSGFVKPPEQDWGYDQELPRLSNELKLAEHRLKGMTIRKGGPIANAVLQIFCTAETIAQQISKV